MCASLSHSLARSPVPIKLLLLPNLLAGRGCHFYAKRIGRTGVGPNFRPEKKQGRLRRALGPAALADRIDCGDRRRVTGAAWSPLWRGNMGAFRADTHARLGSQPLSGAVLPACMCLLHSWLTGWRCVCMRMDGIFHNANASLFVRRPT
jgi:hypothetical protein